MKIYIDLDINNISRYEMSDMINNVARNAEYSF